MKKVNFARIGLAAAVSTAMLITGCGASSGSSAGAASSSATVAGTAASTSSSTEANAVHGKIAVMRNMASSDNTSQFFQGIEDTGAQLGYSVDTYMSDGDDVKMQNLMTQMLNQDYDIWIVSHANEGYQFDMVSKAVDKGIKVVCFDCSGDEVDGVTYTKQDDQGLAERSLDALIEAAEKNGATEPIKIIEVNTLGAIKPFDTRHDAITAYQDAGKIDVVNLISPNLTGGNSYSDINTGVSTTLTNNPDVQGVWVASTAFLDGVVDALNSANRTDIVMTGVDVSNTEIKRMAETENDVALACVDPYRIGEVDTRLAVMKVLGKETPAEYTFDAVTLTRDEVTADDTMATLAEKSDSFGPTDDFTDDVKEYEVSQ